MWASVVLPRPGGPNSSTWSSASRRLLAASMKISSCSRIFGWPTYSSRRLGRRARSSASSCADLDCGAMMRSAAAGGAISLSVSIIQTVPRAASAGAACPPRASKTGPRKMPMKPKTSHATQHAERDEQDGQPGTTGDQDGFDEIVDAADDEQAVQHQEYCPEAVCPSLYSQAAAPAPDQRPGQSGIIDRKKVAKPSSTASGSATGNQEADHGHRALRRGRADNAEHDAHDRTARLVEHVLAQFAAQLARADVERLADRRTVAVQEKGDEQDQGQLQQAIGHDTAERQPQVGGPRRSAAGRPALSSSRSPARRCQLSSISPPTTGRPLSQSGGLAGSPLLDLELLK